MHIAILPGSWCTARDGEHACRARESEVGPLHLPEFQSNPKNVKNLAAQIYVALSTVSR